MTSRTRGFRALALGALVAAGLALAPSAFAHGGFGIGINLPGLSIGVGPHHPGYVGIGGGGYYSPGYAPAYYAPAPVVYDDYYYDAPVYGGGYYGGGYNRHQYHYYRGGGYYHGYHGGYHHDYHHNYHDGGYSHGGYHHR